MDDIERGTVWEESIIFLPPHIKILALSATLPNIDELIAWLTEVHKHSVKKITEYKRPVPLHFYFQVGNRIFSNLKNIQKHIAKNRNKSFQFNRVNSLIQYLKENNFLPCIYFCFSRNKCEKFAQELSNFNFLNAEERTKISKFYNYYIEKFKIQNHYSTRSIYQLLQKGIGYHHAGLLPPLKEIIERLFAEKLIKVIFTTETFALGINMPSRTVCFDEILKYQKRKINYLKIRDFYQMAGRAGRRGIDREGYVFVRLKPYMRDIRAMHRIKEGEPEEIRSQFNASYATILNLYRDLKEELIEIYPRTFHYFQQGRKKQGERKLLEKKLKLLKYLKYIKNNKLTPKGIFASNIFGHELIISELWNRNYFEHISGIELAILVSGIVSEGGPKSKSETLQLDKRTKMIKRDLDLTAKRIQKLEKRFQIHPWTKMAHLKFSSAIRLWLRGKSFNQLLESTQEDEGEIIKNFRMTAQVLRDMNQKIISPDLRIKINKILQLLNRDIVNAEWQLKI